MGNYCCCCCYSNKSSNDDRRFDIVSSYQGDWMEQTTTRPRRPETTVSSYEEKQRRAMKRKPPTFQDLGTHSVDVTQNKRSYQVSSEYDQSQLAKDKTPQSMTPFENNHLYANNKTTDIEYSVSKSKRHTPPHQLQGSKNKKLRQSEVIIKSSDTIPASQSSCRDEFNANKTDTHILTTEEKEVVSTLYKIRINAKTFIAEIEKFEELETSNKHYYIEESLRRLIEKLDDMYEEIGDNKYLIDQRKKVYKCIFPLFEKLDDKVTENKNKIPANKIKCQSEDALT